MIVGFQIWTSLFFVVAAISFQFGFLFPIVAGDFRRCCENLMTKYEWRIDILHDFMFKSFFWMDFYLSFFLWLYWAVVIDYDSYSYVMIDWFPVVPLKYYDVISILSLTFIPVIAGFRLICFLYSNSDSCRYINRNRMHRDGGRDGRRRASA